MLIVIFGAIYDALPLIPLAIGLVWTLRYQKVADLSLAGSFAIAAGITAMMLASGMSAVLSIAGGIAVGLVIGLLMALAVNVLRVDALMAGLIVLFIGYAVSIGITQGTITIPTSNNPIEPVLAWERAGGFPLWIHPWLGLLFCFVSASIILGTYLLLRSEWGCAYRALENQESGRAFLKSLGVRPGRLSTIGFVGAAALASISGILVALRDGQATSSLGLDSLIEIIPAYLLGIALFEKRPSLRRKLSHQKSMSPWRRMTAFASRMIGGLRVAPASLAAGLGVLLFFLIVNAAQRWAGVPWLPRAIIGLVILAALGFRPAWDTWRRSQRQRAATELRSSDEELVVTDLSVVYPTVSGPKVVLSDFNLRAGPGEIVLLQGPNGCGKTTFLRALTENIDSEGRFRLPVNGTNGSSARYLGRGHLVGYVPQDAAASTAGSLSISEHAALAWCGATPSPIRRWSRAGKKATPLLGVTDVTQDTGALLQWLSGGQVRRVLLGLLNVRRDKPVVVALDEPYSHLDTKGKEHCTKVISDLAANGAIVLLIDHGIHIEPTRRYEGNWNRTTGQEVESNREWEKEDVR